MRGTRWRWAGLVAALLMAGCVGAPVAGERETALRVATFNVRYANPGDGAHHWNFRRLRVVQLVDFHDVDVLGLQEALASQLADLDAAWPEFTRVGVGRDDGLAGGEFSPLYVRRDRLEVLDSGTFWLSETPEQPSADWAKLQRICTWARLRDRRTMEGLLVMNTHWDHQSAEAREKSAQLMVERARGLAGDGDFPVVLMGDLNCEEDSPPCAVLAGGESPFFDARVVSVEAPYGPTGTFTGFGVPPETERASRRIDFIWVRGALTVERYGVLPHFWDGRLASDHRPVLAVIEIGEAARGGSSGEMTRERTDR